MRVNVHQKHLHQMGLQFKQVLVGLLLLHSRLVARVNRLLNICIQSLCARMVGILLNPLGQLVKEDGALKGEHLLRYLRVLVH